MIEVIRFKRGQKNNLPSLQVGEPAVTTDTNEMYVGMANGNVKVPTQPDLDSINSSLAESANAIGILIDKDFKRINPEVSDSPRIQRAIDSLPTTGGKIQFSAQTYTITGTVTVNKSNVALIGIDRFLTLWQLADNINQDMVFSQNYDNVTVQHIGFNGNKATNNGTTNTAVELVNGKNLKIVDCYVYNANRGIKIRAGNQCDINRNLVDNCGDNLYLDMKESKVLHNISINSGDTGITLLSNDSSWSAWGNVIEGNVIVDPTNFGIILGADIGDVHHNTIVGNTVYFTQVKAGSKGIVLWSYDDTQYLVYDNIIKGNVVFGAGYVGISVELGSHHNTIEGNEVDGNNISQIGIDLYQSGASLSCTDNNIINNHVHHVNGRGIHAVNAHRNRIKNNHVHDNNGNGIYTLGSNELDICENTVENNKYSGIWVNGGNIQNVNRNRIKNNAQANDPTDRFGIVVSGISRLKANDNIVTDDQATKTQYYGLYLTGTCTNVNMKDNDCTNGSSNTNIFLDPQPTAGNIFFGDNYGTTNYA